MVGFFNGGKGIWLGLLGAVISGALMSIQGVFNTKVNDTTGIWTANSFVQFTAFLVCLSAWALKERHSFLKIMEVEPKYMLLGGVLGAFITLTVIMSMSSLGPAKAVLLIVIAQSLVAYLIELLGIFEVEKQPFLWHKLIGILVAAVGFVIFQWNS